jgi:carbonic anhydrase/acetyltransferase-like protein (isoleucine patch superfamily)
LSKFKDSVPRVSTSATIFPGAKIIGNVTIGDDSSIWFNSVLRGDINRIEIGRMTNIQDLSLCHVVDELPCVIGDFVTVGHSSIIHACTVGSQVLVGMGATVLDGAVLEDRSMVAAGALVPPGMVVPSGTMVVGRPAKVMRVLTDEELDSIRARAEKYAKLARLYRNG